MQTSSSPARADGVDPDALLTRVLGVRQFASNIFNYTVGSGIFLLPATAVMNLGTAAPLAYIACAIVIGLVVLCFAEAGSRVHATGGAYAYVETAMGPLFGFIAGCLIFTTGMFAASAVFNGAARSLIALFTSGSHPWLARALIVIFVTVLVGLNMHGVRSSARVLETITVLKLAPLLAFIVIGACFVDPANLAWTDIPDSSAVLGTAGIVIFAFSGIEGATVPSGEVKQSARTVPLAILLALGVSTVLYMAIQYVALGIMGLELAHTGRVPLAAAAAAALGPVARAVMIAAAVISMFGYLSANVLSEPRGLFALSRDGFLPRWFSHVDPTYRTPNTAIMIYGGMVTAIALTGSFEWLTIFANLAALALYFLTAVAVLILRKRNVRSEGDPFVIPGGPLVPLAACASIAWLFFETARDGSQLSALLIALAIILALYGVRALRRRHASP